jgi:hypothetical protein
VGLAGSSLSTTPHLDLHVNVPCDPVLVRISCEVIARENWHMTRSAVLQPERSWNGKRTGETALSLSSSHPVSESRRPESDASGCSSWRVMSEEDSSPSSLDESSRGRSEHRNMSHRSDESSIIYGERCLCDGAIRSVSRADIGETQNAATLTVAIACPLDDCISVNSHRTSITFN